MDKELIERMKQNRVRDELLTCKEKECLQEVGAKNCEYFSTDKIWCPAAYLNSAHVFRIKPDYQPPKPEPKIVKCEVYVKKNKKLHFTYGGEDYASEVATRIISFLYFETVGELKVRIEDVATQIRNGGKVYACFVKDNNE